MHRVYSTLVRQCSPNLQFSRTSVQLATEAITTKTAQWENAKPYNEIPGPRPLPIIGNAWRFLPLIGTIPVDDFLKWIQHVHKTYGPISKLSNIPGKRDLVFLFDPQDFETLLRHEGQWPERFMFQSLPYYRKVERKDFFEGIGGVLVENGEEWQKSRTYVNPVMMQPRNAKKYATRIDEITQEFVSKLPAMLDEKQETTVHFTREVQKWALESISMVALDTRLGCLQDNLAPDSDPYRLIKAADEVFELIFHLDFKFPLWKYVTTPTWRRFVKVLDTFVEISLRHIEKAHQRLQEHPHENEADMSVLEKLLLRDPNPKKATVMALDMMMAGIDTTSFTSIGTLYHLARNPKQQETLYAELKKALPSPDTPLTAEILEELKYLKACVKENNRMNPIAIGVGRCIPEDIVVSNYRVPKGTDVLACNMIVTTSDQYFPRASSFIPERWLKHNDDGKCPVQAGKKAHPFAMMPFGFGKRNCVGMRFALLEIESMVARVVRKYRLQWHYGEMRFKAVGVHRPIDPVRLHLTPRDQ